MMDIEEVLTGRLRDRETGPPMITYPEIEQARDTIRALREALKPFAQHVGKSGEQVTLTIGKDTWTETLTTDDFERARAVRRRK